MTDRVDDRTHDGDEQSHNGGSQQHQPRGRSPSPPRERSGRAAGGNAPGANATDRGKVYIGNVPSSMTERDVRDLFGPVFDAGATVESIHFKNGPMGRYGFVHFAKSTTLLPELVAKINGTEWGGQKLRIEFSRLNGIKCGQCGRDNHRTSECRLGRPGGDRGAGRDTRYAGPPPPLSAPFRGGGGMGPRGRSRSRSRSPSKLEFQRGRDFDRTGARAAPPMAYDAPAPRLDDRARDFDARAAYPSDRMRDARPLGPPLDSERDRAYYAPPTERERFDRDRYAAPLDRDRGYPPVGMPPAPLGALPPTAGGYSARGRSRSPSPRRDVPPPPVVRRRSRSRSRSKSPRGGRGRSPYGRSGPVAGYPAYPPVNGSSAYPAAYPAPYGGANDTRDRAAVYPPVNAAGYAGGRERERERDRDPYPPRDARDAYVAPARDSYSARDAYSSRDAPRDSYSAVAPLSPPGGRPVSRDRSERDRRDDRDRRDEPRDVDPRAAAAAYAQWYAAAMAAGAAHAYPADYAAATGYGAAAPSSSSYSGGGGGGRTSSRDRDTYSSSAGYGASYPERDAAPASSGGYSRYSGGGGGGGGY